MTRDRIISAQRTQIDEPVDAALRPRSISEMIGQESLMEKLAIAMSGWDGGGVSTVEPGAMGRIVVGSRNEAPQPAGVGSE